MRQVEETRQGGEEKTRDETKQIMRTDKMRPGEQERDKIRQNEEERR